MINISIQDKIATQRSHLSFIASGSAHNSNKEIDRPTSSRNDKKEVTCPIDEFDGLSNQELKKIILQLKNNTNKKVEQVRKISENDRESSSEVEDNQVAKKNKKRGAIRKIPSDDENDLEVPEERPAKSHQLFGKDFPGATVSIYWVFKEFVEFVKIISSKIS